jgi:hypothetical protein
MLTITLVYLVGVVTGWFVNKKFGTKVTTAVADLSKPEA